MRHWRPIALLALPLALVPPLTGPAAGASQSGPEVLATGLRTPAGVAVARDGTVFATDRDAGTLLRRADHGGLTVVARRLSRPGGVALDAAGQPVVAEEGAGRVVRVEPGGALTALAAGLVRPRWVAIAEDGRIFVAAAGVRPGAGIPAAGEALLALDGAGGVRVVADRFAGLAGLALAGDVLYAAAAGHRDTGRADGLIVAIAVPAGGPAGPVVPLTTPGQVRRPAGLAIDVLGTVWASAEQLAIAPKPVKRAIARRAPDGALTAFAADLGEPLGLAFDPHGHLLVADGKGRLLRFPAPAVPVLHVPETLTRQSPLPLGGHAEPGGHVTVVVEPAGEVLTAAADGQGHFAVPVPLTADTLNEVAVVVTGRGGLGLASAAAEVHITHDGQPPVISLDVPAAGAVVRGALAVQVGVTDAGSGVATAAVVAGGRALPASLAPAPPAAALAATAPWDTAAEPDGATTLGATATDRAGNAASATRVVVVDNTAPETAITGLQVAGREATIGFTGADGITPPGQLEFSWRLDDGPWSGFGPESTLTLRDLPAGDRRFEVRARDRAGNEDPTPARQVFTVGGDALRVVVTEPPDGAVVVEGPVLVRGTVEGAGPGDGVTVNGVPAARGPGAFAAVVPVTPATEALSAVLTRADGASAAHRIAIAVVPAAPRPLALEVAPAGGPAPLTVTFSVLADEAPQWVELDADGDGSADVAGPALDDHRVTYAGAGLYTPVAVVTDAAGQRHRLTAVVEVVDAPGLAAALEQRWTALKDALRRGDLDAALAGISPGARARYEAVFRALPLDLPQIDAILTDLALVEVGRHAAIHRMLRVDAGVLVSYEVRFRRDGDGVWRLSSF